MKKKNAAGLLVSLAILLGLSIAGTESSAYAQAYQNEIAENTEYKTEDKIEGKIEENTGAESGDSRNEPEVYYAGSAIDIGMAMQEAGMAENVSTEAIGSEYQLKRIIIYADELPDTCGADSVICYDKYNYYILGFESETDTETAYRYLVNKYGADKCMLDQTLYSDDVYDREVSEQAAIAESGRYNAVSWGTTYMGMDRLKAEVSDYNVVSDVDIAVIDTGINASDTLFEGRINTADSVNCYNSDAADDYSDTLGHGSHVAGIIADATPDNVKLTIIRCFSDAGATSVSVIQRGIMAALDRGVDIINMSFCFYGSNASENTRSMLDPLLDQANADNVVMCVAAGNSNKSVNNWGISDVEGVSYPADSDKVITVSALMQISGTEYTADRVSTSTVKFADTYSYYGNAVDFSAPGSYITSAWKTGTSHGHVNSGTSMAAPHISAAAAYVRMMEPALSNTDLKSRLLEYSVDLGETGKDKYYGYGCPYMAGYFQEHAERKKQELGRCGLESIKNTQQGLGISWTAVDGATAYKIYRKSTGETYSCIYIADGNTKTFVDKSVVSGKRYRYAVRPVRYEETGAAENAVELLRLSQPEVTVANGYRGIVVFWSRVSGASKYNIYRKKAGSSAWTLVKSTSGDVVSVTDSSVDKGTAYRYTVKAYGSGTWSAYDTSGAAMYRITTCRITSVTSAARRNISVKWQKSSETSGYLIQYSDTKTFAKYKNIMVSGSAVTSKNVIVKNAGAVYYFRMRSYKVVNGRTYYGGWTAARKVISGK